MTIVQLEYFLAVAAHGSFATAAENCFVTAPALSMQISALEAEMGVPLLDRTKKPIVATEAGEAFLEQARKTIVQFSKTREAIGSVKGRLSGNLRIGVVPTITPYLIPHFVPLFSRRCPDVRLRVSDMYTADMVDALARDRIDIGVMLGGRSEVKIRETELFDDRLYMYVAPKNRLFGKEKISIRDVDIDKLLILSEGVCLRNQTLELCQARRAANPPFDFVRCSLETLMQTAENTAGTTIVPSMAIQSIPEERRDRIIPFDVPNARRRITMAVSPTFAREKLVEVVRRTILDVAEERLALSDFLLRR